MCVVFPFSVRQMFQSRRSVLFLICVFYERTNVYDRNAVAQSFSGSFISTTNKGLKTLAASKVVRSAANLKLKNWEIL